MALGSVKQEVQDNRGISCRSDVRTKNGFGPVGFCTASRPINALGNTPSVGLHPIYRASLFLFSQQFPVTGGISSRRSSIEIPEP